MKYFNIKQGKFVSRPNRFIANVEIDGKTEVCHVKNTGRCKELLCPGATVLLEEVDHPGRKTKYDLVSVYKGDTLINMDSQMPNALVKEWLENNEIFPEMTKLQPETKYGNSRFDFYVEYQDKKAFIEVKGVTLEEDGHAKFPDAPTLRGIKHMQELQKCVDEGYEAWLFFIIQMKGVYKFGPSWNTHPEFGEELIRACEHGVYVQAWDCIVEPSYLRIDRRIPIDLRRGAEG